MNDLFESRSDPWVYHNTTAAILAQIKADGSMSGGSFAIRPIRFSGDVWIAARVSDLPTKNGRPLVPHDYDGVMAYEPVWEPEMDSSTWQTMPISKLFLATRRGRIIGSL